MPYTIKVVQPGSRVLFDALCDGLVESVRKAADPTTKDWYPYYGEVVGIAVWNARNVMRKARSLGLIPSTAQLEAESRRVA